MEHPIEIARKVTEVQRREIAGCVRDLISLSMRFAEQGLALGPHDADDPAAHLCDMTTSLALDDWEALPEIVFEVIRQSSPDSADG